MSFHVTWGLCTHTAVGQFGPLGNSSELHSECIWTPGTKAVLCVVWAGVKGVFQSVRIPNMKRLFVLRELIVSRRDRKLLFRASLSLSPHLQDQDFFQWDKIKGSNACVARSHSKFNANLSAKLWRPHDTRGVGAECLNMECLVYLDLPSQNNAN